MIEFATAASVELLKEKVASKWGLTDVTPMAETPRGWLYSCQAPQGEAVLKLHSEEGREDLQAATVLEHWAGRGAISLWQREGPALLLERAEDSRSLVDMVGGGDDQAACAVIADVAQKLQQNPAPATCPDGMTTLAGRFNQLFQPLQPQTPPALAKVVPQAAAAARHLLETSAVPTIIHGDLHHENVLYAGADRGWLAIDPKGYWADPAHEYANPMVNPAQHTDIVADPALLIRRAVFYGQVSGIAPARLLAHALCEAAVIAVWWAHFDPEYGHFAKTTVAAAKACIQLPLTST